jgi:hypothetical protein
MRGDLWFASTSGSFLCRKRSMGARKGGRVSGAAYEERLSRKSRAMYYLVPAKLVGRKCP